MGESKGTGRTAFFSRAGRAALRGRSGVVIVFDSAQPTVTPNVQNCSEDITDQNCALQLANQHRGHANHNRSAVSRHVSHSCGRHTAYHDRDRPHGDHIRRSDTSGHIPNTSSRHRADQNGYASRRQDRASDMRHYTRDEGTDMHIANSCRWLAHFKTLPFLFFHCLHKQYQYRTGE